MSIQRYKNRMTPDGDWLTKADDGDWMLHADPLAAITAERDALRERLARLVGAMQDIARSEVWYASELREMARTALGDK